MTYDTGWRIVSQGQATAAQITAYFRANTDGAIPDDLGETIIAACRTWPDHIVNHDGVAALAGKESAFLQSRIARDKHNPSGLGASNDDPYENAIDCETWLEGFTLTVTHLLSYAVGDGPWTNVDPRWQFMSSDQRGKCPRWIDLNGNWAVPGVGYGQNVIKRANDLLETAMPEPIRVALSAGHHNTSGGGTAGEKERTGVLTAEIARQMRDAGGFDVRVVQPDDGRGDYPGDLYDAAYQVVKWDREGWKADLFLCPHFDGNNAGDDARGSFSVYPDWSSSDGMIDLDADVRDVLGPSIALKLQELTGLPVRFNGAFSERSTPVAHEGYRLGVFRATAELRGSLTRLIYEYGALTAPSDKAIIDGPAWFERAARATMLAVAAFYGVDVSDGERSDDALYLPGSPFGEVPIVAGFRDLFEGQGAQKFAPDPIAGAVSLFGYPQTAEFPTDYGSAQIFERAIFKWFRDVDPPFDLVIALRSEPIPERAA